MWRLNFLDDRFDFFMERRVVRGIGFDRIPLKKKGQLL